MSGRAPKRTSRATSEEVKVAEQSTPNRNDGHFKKGRAKTGGRKPKADVWAMLEKAADIANARASENGGTADLTNELLVADLIDTVRRLDPATAMRVLVPTIYPRATVKPVNVEIDTSPEGLPGSLEKLAAAMASGGDIASLTAVFNTLKAVQDARATALEMRALERELDQ